MDVEGGNTNRHAAPRRNSFMMINDFVFLMNKMRLSTPVVFEMENSQLLQDTARQICILYGIIPYPVRTMPPCIAPQVHKCYVHRCHFLFPRSWAYSMVQFEGFLSR
jgi:hypothetical protein